MVNALVDTDVLIDILRQHLPAETWFYQQTQLGVAAIVGIELFQGASNKLGQQQIIKLLKNLERIELEPTDYQWASQALIQFNLSHGLLGFDALIASVSYRLQVPLYTRNLKHFRPILGNLAQSPY